MVLAQPCRQPLPASKVADIFFLSQNISKGGSRLGKVRGCIIIPGIYTLLHSSCTVISHTDAFFVHSVGIIIIYSTSVVNFRRQYSVLLDHCKGSSGAPALYIYTCSELKVVLWIIDLVTLRTKGHIYRMTARQV